MNKMNKKMLLTSILTMSLAMSAMSAFADTPTTLEAKPPLQKVTKVPYKAPETKIDRQKKAEEFNKMLETRLNLTQEQINTIEKNRKKYRKEMQKVFNDMRKEQKAIRDVYMTGIPEYQAKVKTSASKAKLALLKQKADTLREENLKNFEAVLTQEQKTEFEKIKTEMKEKRKSHHHRRMIMPVQKPVPVEK